MRTSNYSKMIISTLIVCAVIFSTGYSKATRVDSLGLAGDNFDLYGALELFKKSNSPEEFEKNLNSQGNGINNLDLNGDHQTDYIRVVDQSQGDSHSLVMQDALSANDVQNVAVISMQKINNQIHVQIKGDEALYGKDYIIEPSDPSNSQTTNGQNSTSYNNNNSQNSNGYNNNGQNSNGYNNNNNGYNNNNGQNSNSNYDPNYPNSNPNNNNGYNNNNYNNNGQNGNGYNNDTYNNYNNSSNNYNNNYSYGGQYQSINVVAWPAVQFIYGPQYVPYASPWRWNAYPGWWNPWRTVGWPAYYGRMNMYHPYYGRVNTYHPYYSPINNINRAGYPHQAYYPNRSYAPSTTLIQNRYTNVNNSVHYGPRNNGIGNSGGMRTNGGYNGGGGFNGGGMRTGGGGFNGGGFHGGGGGFHGGGGFSGGGGGFHGGGGFSGGGGGFHGGGGFGSGGGGGRRR